jgi:hypothetical protein
MYTAAVGVAWLLLGSPCKGQAWLLLGSPCKGRGVVTARLTLQRPGCVIHLSKSFTFLQVNSQGQSLWATFVKRKLNALLRMRSASPTTNLPLQRQLLLASVRVSGIGRFFRPPGTVIIMAAPNRNYKLYVFPRIWSNNLRHL